MLSPPKIVSAPSGRLAHIACKAYNTSRTTHRSGLLPEAARDFRREPDDKTDKPQNRCSDRRYGRPSGYRAGVRDDVWEQNKGPDGKVRDPVTQTEIRPGDKWDMGHRPGYEFRKHQHSAGARGLSRKDFLDEHNGPSHYRPELPSSNRGHAGELKTSDWLGILHVTMPTDENRQLARSIADALGGTPSVHEYHDDEQVLTIDIMTCIDAPQQGVNSYATLALSDVAIFNEELGFGIEIVAACETDAPQFAEVISSCVFGIIKDRIPIYPGAVLPRMLDLFEGLSSTLSHAFFVDPFLWGDGAFSSRKLATKTVAFLQMIPISNSEYKFWRENGPDALERRFEERQIDIFDINRPSAV